MHYDLTTLPNGLRVISQDMPSVRSVSIGMWVDTGSRDEIANLLNTYDLTDDPAALTELIRIDIELRYKHGIPVRGNG